ncbi:hypothetical protein FDP41_009372 [Naegleria fowleri]|uniref:Uncharacterized protein n=1 Tax=Naegleria fowleri TaxID=5763 RepID=A0A6A5BHH9_NAEFO|nr:uncharacterized protein FDP41_009372 [Naegleria fowleri]KAF0972469.1 hypothetical protein FDP41_009372 [Naegleria fowleri]CAG4718227.1 unnamed protein product [Naegleria fowleri]
MSQETSVFSQQHQQQQQPFKTVPLQEHSLLQSSSSRSSFCTTTTTLPNFVSAMEISSPDMPSPFLGRCTSAAMKDMMSMNQSAEKVVSSSTVNHDHRRDFQEPLRIRRRVVLPKLIVPNLESVHECVLLECKEKELYLKLGKFRENRVDEILDMFERNTFYTTNISNQPTETKDLSNQYACKYFPTSHRNVNQIVLFKKDDDERNNKSSSNQILENHLITKSSMMTSPPENKKEATTLSPQHQKYFQKSSPLQRSKLDFIPHTTFTFSSNHDGEGYSHQKLNKASKRKFMDVEECWAYEAGTVNNNNPQGCSTLTNSYNYNCKRLTLTNPTNDLISLDLKVKKTSSVFAHAKLRKQKAQSKQMYSSPSFHDRIA